MSRIQEQKQSHRKRKRVEAASSFDDIVGPKRLKSNFKLHSAAFYDSLSKVPLTRRALKELDRRISDINISHWQSVPEAGPVYHGEALKQLQRFARYGVPELRDLRAHPAPIHIRSSRTMNSKRSSRTRRTAEPAELVESASNITSSSKRSSAYDNAFEQHLVDHSVFLEGHDYHCRRTPEPDNLEELRRKLAEPRPSLSPTQFTVSQFRDLQRNNRARSETKVLRQILPVLCGKAKIPNECDLVFTRLESITNGLTVDTKPDFYDGAHLDDIHLPVREELGPYIVPSSLYKAPAAPNFFAEGRQGDAGVGKRQACYNGALGARAMHELQSYDQAKPIFDNNAYSLTATCCAGTLRLYTTHVTLGVKGSPEYHMSTVGGWDTIGDIDTCRRGITAFRNGRDWAQETRDQFISAANERSSGVPCTTGVEDTDLMGRVGEGGQEEEQGGQEEEDEDEDEDEEEEDEDEDEEEHRTPKPSVPTDCSNTNATESETSGDELAGEKYARPAYTAPIRRQKRQKLAP